MKRRPAEILAVPPRGPCYRVAVSASVARETGLKELERGGGLVAPRPVERDQIRFCAALGLDQGGEDRGREARLVELAGWLTAET